MIEIALELLQSTRTSPRQLYNLIGKRVSLAELVHLGFPNARPLQWAARDRWTTDTDNWDVVLPLTPMIHDAIDEGELHSNELELLEQMSKRSNVVSFLFSEGYIITVSKFIKNKSSVLSCFCIKQ